jgi:hypothetical protein
MMLSEFVEFFTTKPTKLILHFSDFSVHFYEFYKLWPKHPKEGRIYLLKSPWELFRFHTKALDLHKTPWKGSRSCNVTPWAMGRWLNRNSGDPSPVFDWGTGGGGVVAHQGSDCDQSWGGGAASEVVRRRCTTATVRSSSPTSWPARQGHKRRRKLLEALVVVEKASGARVRSRDREPVVGGGKSSRQQQWCMAACVLARETGEVAFYRCGTSWRGGNMHVKSLASRGMGEGRRRRAARAAGQWREAVRPTDA